MTLKFCYSHIVIRSFTQVMKRGKSYLNTLLRIATSDGQMKNECQNNIFLMDLYFPYILFVCMRFYLKKIIVFMNHL